MSDSPAYLIFYSDKNELVLMERPARRRALFDFHMITHWEPSLQYGNATGSNKEREAWMRSG